MSEERFAKVVQKAGVFREHLVGKRVVGLEVIPRGFLLFLDDDSQLQLKTESGVGGDSNWYNWVSIRIPGVGEIQFE